MNSRCDRFETEALLRLERGEPLDDEHFATCPDCREARAAYERLRQEIAEVEAEEEPPPGWQARVWERIEQRRRPRWAWFLAPLGATALAALLFFALPRTPSAPSLTQEVVAGDAVVRSASAHPGDRLELRVETAGSPHAELRVYRNERELVLRCPSDAGDPSCRRDGDELRASLILPSAGDYQAMLILDDEPLPPPRNGLDPDAGAAFAQDAQVLLGEEISVR